MGLNSVEESIQRVATRVRLGGHKVSEDSIRYNYEYGFKNLYQFFSAFETITLFDNAIASKDLPPTAILYIAEHKLHLQVKKYPKWVEPIVSHFNKAASGD